jgi:CubicO group peptidase (beta-lactamase class C family)
MLRLAPTLLITSLLGLAAPAGAGDFASTLVSLPAGTGFTSLDLCTRTNTSGDDFTRVRDSFVTPVVQPLPSYWSVSNKPGVNVTTSALGLVSPRTAAYRKGLGCTVVKNSFDEWLLRLQAFTPVAMPVASAAAWPAGEGLAEAGRLTPMQQNTINNLAEEIFTETATDPAKKLNTFALLVAKDGHLVFERYAPGYHRNQAQLGWSMTKSLTTLVAGVMEKEGRLRLDAPVGLKRWNYTGKAVITWRQLLSMTSGLKWDESGTANPNDVYEMLFSQYDQAAWAADKPLAATPGSSFTYSTGAHTIAMAAMKEKLGGSHQALYNYYQNKLFTPLGIRGGAIEPDYSGTPIGGARGVLRPVDWLRLGQLVANGGAWKGQQLVSPHWVQFMKTPTTANPAYAGSLWTRADNDIPPDILDYLPPDTVFFAGRHGQFVVIVPSRNLVLLRQGVAHDYPRAATQVFRTLVDLLQQGM